MAANMAAPRDLEENILADSTPDSTFIFLIW